MIYGPPLISFPVPRPSQSTPVSFKGISVPIAISGSTLNSVISLLIGVCVTWYCYSRPHSREAPAAGGGAMRWRRFTLAGKILGPLVMLCSLVTAGISLKENASDRMTPEFLATIAAAINDRTPMYADDSTLITAVSSEGMELIYHCKVENVRRADLDVEAFAKGMQEQVGSNPGNQDERRKFAKAGVTLVMEYRDREGALVAEVRLPPTSSD